MPQNLYPWQPGSHASKVVPVTLGPIPTWVRVGAPTYSSFATAATTNSIIIFNLPPAAIIHGIKIRPSVSFTGGAISAYTISVGDVATPTLYASAFNVFQATGPTVFQLSSNFGGESLAAATAIYATATSTGANLSAATGGVCDILALLSIAK